MFRARMRAMAEQRLRAIAQMRARMPGITQREIQESLATLGLLSPRTGRVYSLGIINRDCQKLDMLAREQVEQDVATHRAREFAELQELKRTAWGDGDLDIVLKAWVQETELLGTKAPAKIAPTNPNGTEYTGLTNVERVARLAAIFDAVRARRDGSPDRGGEQGAGTD